MLNSEFSTKVLHSNTKVRDSNYKRVTFRFVSKSSDLIGYLTAMQFLGGRRE